MVNGDFVHFRGKINEALKSSYWPGFIKEDSWNEVEQKWADLRGLSSYDCSRLYISVLSRYPWFGCNIYPATVFPLMKIFQSAFCLFITFRCVCVERSHCFWLLITARYPFLLKIQK